MEIKIYILLLSFQINEDIELKIKKILILTEDQLITKKKLMQEKELLNNQKE